MTVRIDAGGPAADSYEVTVNGVVYTCVDSTVNPGQLVCTGGSPPQGNTIATISVCPSDQAGVTGRRLLSVVPNQQTAPEGLISFAMPQQPNQLAAFAPSQPEGLQAYAPTNGGRPQLQAFGMQAATNNFCPDGYVFNPSTGTCDQNPGSPCPDGWTFNTETNTCQPNEGGCPEGTSYNAEMQGCTPDDGECPSGYSLRLETNTCEPPQNDGGGACPAGYFYDTRINCCSPLTQTDCEPGSFRSAATNECVPTDENGCPPNTTFNRYEGACEPDLDENGNCRLTGYVMNEPASAFPRILRKPVTMMAAASRVT
jgi:hypothetical protein